MSFAKFQTFGANFLAAKIISYPFNQIFGLALGTAATAAVATVDKNPPSDEKAFKFMDFLKKTTSIGISIGQVLSFIPAFIISSYFKLDQIKLLRIAGPLLLSYNIGSFVGSLIANICYKDQLKNKGSKTLTRGNSTVTTKISDDAKSAVKGWSYLTGSLAVIGTATKMYLNSRNPSSSTPTISL